MAMAIDPADLLCRQGSTPSDFLNVMSPSPLWHNAPYMPGLVSGPSPFDASARPVPPGLAVPPGLDAPHPALLAPSTPARAIDARALEATMMTPPPGRTAMHAWALEAKINAEQAQERQRQWAEKVQRQYVQGQDILKALKPEDSSQEDKGNSGGAFDRLVQQLGLKTGTPSCKGQDEALVGQTPPPKKVSASATPPKA